MCRFWNRTQVQMALVEPPLSDRRPPDRQVPLSGLILARTSFASTGASFVALSINSLSPPPRILRPSRLAVAKRWFLARGLDNRFDASVYRFAQIVHNSKARMIPAPFTWLSKVLF